MWFFDGSSVNKGQSFTETYSVNKMFSIVYLETIEL